MLESTQQVDPIQIIFASRILKNGIECDHYGEAFPDGQKIAFAMNAPDMTSWQEIFGPIGSILILTAHEATHIAQIRRGDPPPSSHEIIVNTSANAYLNERHEVEANQEALSVFKALRPHAKGTLLIGGVSYTIPEKSEYKIDLDEIPDFIKF